MPDTGNRSMEYAFEDTVSEWEREEYGVMCGTVGMITHPNWANNIWLVAGSSILDMMQTDLNKAIER